MTDELIDELRALEIMSRRTARVRGREAAREADRICFANTYEFDIIHAWYLCLGGDCASAAHEGRRALAMRQAADRIAALSAERDALAGRLAALASYAQRSADDYTEDAPDGAPWAYRDMAQRLREGSETE